jgi:hypothetical protein
MMIDPAIGYLITLGLASLFAVAAAHKLKTRAEFARILEAYRLFPPRAAGPLSYLLPLLELATVLGLLVPSSRREAGYASAMLLLVYAVAIAVNLARGRRDLDCGCGLARDRRPIAGWMVVRNAALAAVALAAAWPWAGRALAPLDVVTIVGGAAAAALLYASIDVLLGRVMPKAALVRAR